MQRLVSLKAFMTQNSHETYFCHEQNQPTNQEEFTCELADQDSATSELNHYNSNTRK